ncbi:MAG: hypothetical protein ACRYF2_23620 [Janthinobacterium lividum]
MTNDYDDELPPLPEEVGVHVLIGQMEGLREAIIRGVSRVEQVGTAVTEQAVIIDKSSGRLEHLIRRLTVKSVWWLVGGIVLAALALILASGILGRERGRQEGYDEASTENAAAAWGATDEGRWAYAFAQSGNLAMIRNCTGKGWIISGGLCVPQPAADRLIYGWPTIDRPTLRVRRRHRQSP